MQYCDAMELTKEDNQMAKGLAIIVSHIIRKIMFLMQGVFET